MRNAHPRANVPANISQPTFLSRDDSCDDEQAKCQGNGTYCSSLHGDTPRVS
jgi:hypothetical protein